EALLRIWEVATGREVTKVNGHPQAPLSAQEGQRRVSLSPDGKLLAVTDHQHVRLFEAKTGREVQSKIYGWHGVPPLWVAFNPDGKSLAAIGDLGPLTPAWEVRIWDREAEAVELRGSSVMQIIDAGGHLVGLVGQVFSPDGGRLAFVGWDLFGGSVVRCYDFR